MSRPLKVLALLGVLFLAVMFGPNREERPKTGSARDACYMAQKFVSDRIKAPATADFELCSDAKVAPKVDSDVGTCYTVVSYVDSQNSFGAKIRTNYAAEVRYDGYDPARREYDWQLISLTMEGKNWNNPNKRESCSK